MLWINLLQIQIQSRVIYLFLQLNMDQTMIFISTAAQKWNVIFSESGSTSTIHDLPYSGSG